MVDNLAKLDSIAPDIVLKTLEDRHRNDEIYTKNGSVLIAINPYKRLNIYEETQLKTYQSSLALDEEDPHVFAVAAAAHRNMISGGKNQAVIISGESGAGKTESASFMLQYLRYVSNAGDELEQRISGASPLTEAFGCAKTVRNDNSSRFGKFLKLHFDASAKIQGAELSTYLLEKSRVTHVGPGERSYHIFYCLLRGGGGALPKLGLKPDPKTYAYLSKGETGEPGGMRKDAPFFTEVVEALSSQGLEEGELFQFWQLLAGVLHLGNIVFDQSKTDAATVLKSGLESIPKCEEALGLRAGVLQQGLSKSKLRINKEFVEKDLSLSQATDNRDALSKAIYTRLFDHLRNTINTALEKSTKGVLGGAQPRAIGIVDIFGFEVFQINSLEQLCINYANEKLQSLFTQTVFKETIKAYEQEGIDASEITFTDNSELLTLLEAPKVGLFATLAEECLVPKGSDAGFSEKLSSQHNKSALLKRVKGMSAAQGFALQHFAGEVGYSTASWLDKNKDPLSGDLEDLMRCSDIDLLKQLFESPEEAAPAPGKKFKSTAFKGVTQTFRQQLGELKDVLEASELHFVRCFKPNDKKAADLTEADVIKRQLHTSGVLDALRVARTGYPDRLHFDEFCSTFAAIYKGAGGSKGLSSTPAGKQRCVKLLEASAIPQSSYKLGRERIFFATGVLDGLKAQRVKLMAAVAGVLQAGGRGLIARAKARNLKAEIAAAEESLAAATASSGAESGPQKRSARAGVWRTSFGSLPSALTCTSARSRWNRRVPFMSLAATREPSDEIAEALR